MENKIEIDDHDFYNELFNNPPQPANSMRIDLDADNITQLFERLIQIFHQATIKFHGDENNKVELKKLTITDFLHINKYFNSFGLCVEFKIGKLSELKKLEEFIIGKNNNFIEDRVLNIEDIINYKERVTNRLSDLRFNICTNDEIYVIWFDYI